MHLGLFLLFFGLGLFTLQAGNAYAESSLTFSKTLDVETQDFQETLVDIQNYEKVFSEFIQSSKIVDSTQEKTIADVSLDFGILPMTVKVEHSILDDELHQLSVISGDLKGTKMVTKLEKTWSYDGIPNKGTIVNMDISLQISGFLSLLNIVNEDLIRYSVDNSLLRLADYSKGSFAEETPENPTIKKRR